MVRLSREEKVVYTALIRLSRAKGFVPTRKELSEFTGLSLYKIQQSVYGLEAAALIEVKPRTPRAIKLVGYEFVPRRDHANFL